MAPDQLTTELDVAAWARAQAGGWTATRPSQDMGWLLDLPADLQARAISPEFYVLRRDREVRTATGRHRSST